MVVNTLALNALHPASVLLLYSFLFPNVVADLHLSFNQVLCLSKRTHKLLPLFALQVAHFLFLHYAGHPQLLLLVLKLLLLLHKLLSENLFFIVKVHEDI